MGPHAAGSVLRVVLVGGTVLAVLAPATSASASTKLKFYSKESSFSFLSAAGKKIAAPTGPGDGYTSTDVNYVGDHKKHAKKWTSTDHSTCTLTSETTALCDIQIAIGGSLLLSDNVKVTLDPSKTTITVPITGGTGKYKKAKGSLKSTQLSETTSDMVITLK